MPCLVLLRVAPADPLVPAAQVAGHRLEQETPQDPLLSVPNERLHLAAERVLGAQVVMIVDRRVPDLRLLRTLDPLERDRLKIRQRRGHRRLLDRKAQIHRVQAGRPYRHTIHRQGQDSERLQTLQGTQTNGIKLRILRIKLSTRGMTGISRCLFLTISVFFSFSYLLFWNVLMGFRDWRLKLRPGLSFCA